MPDSWTANRWLERFWPRPPAGQGTSGFGAGGPPCLALVLVDEDPRSMKFVRMKMLRCGEASLTLRLVQVAGEADSSEAIAAVSDLSRDSSVDGLFVQYPLPPHVNQRLIFEAIDPEKDVDGVTACSYGALVLDRPGFRPCTAVGIMLLLEHYGVDPQGLHAVVIGTSPQLVKPIGMLLLARYATVAYSDSDAQDVAATTRSADILVTAAGRPKLVRGSWLKPGAVVIDASYYSGTVGDVDVDEAVLSAGLICPVPGGVGPMTIAVLLHQTVLAAERRCLPS